MHNVQSETLIRQREYTWVTSISTCPNWCNRKWSKMAAAKPEVLESQLLCKIATKFQRLHPHFRSPTTRQDQCGHSDIRVISKSKMAAITGSTYEITQYLSFYILDSDKIPKAAPKFSGSSNTAGIIWTLADIRVTGKSKMAAITRGEYVISQINALPSVLDINDIPNATHNLSGSRHISKQR